jgi:hypothetical protein
MVDLIMQYEWAIVLLGAVAFGFWELYALRRDRRRTEKRGRNDTPE